MYVKGSWSPDVDATNHSFSHKGTQAIGAAYYTFERLVSSNKSGWYRDGAGIA